MKLYNLVIHFLVLAGSISAGATIEDSLKYSPDSPSKEHIRSVRDGLEPLFFIMKGVGASGVTACDAQSGKPFTLLSPDEISTKLFVHCIQIYTETKEAESALKTLIPLGTKAEGVFLGVAYAGTIRPR